VEKVIQAEEKTKKLDCYLKDLAIEKKMPFPMP
jgi:hypothetical protein